eukprot:TRINITY_DN15747_c0_g1_i1.p1 TRINITY_DN15747_c0_g1~~TRINITY_DN15747_c0_g1_i1.p1  ORF type:complete len:128 (-),score=5.27 TRINITY_DN15747_c0_g1_i1:35-418(-)
MTHTGFLCLAFAVSFVVLLGGINDTLDKFTASPPSANGPFWYFTETPPGALVEVSYLSTVGVILDDVPMNIRERVAKYYLNQDESFWEQKARLQGFMLEFSQVSDVFYINIFNAPLVVRNYTCNSNH